MDTLTKMLVESDTHFEQDQIVAAKEVFKDWLKEVGLGIYSTPESVRKLLIMLVDEP